MQHNITNQESGMTTTEDRFGPKYLREQLNELLYTSSTGLNKDSQKVIDEGLIRLLHSKSIKGSLGRDIDSELVMYILVEAPKTFATLHLVFDEPLSRYRAIQSFKQSHFGDDILSSEPGEITLCDSLPHGEMCKQPHPHHFPSMDPWTDDSLHLFIKLRRKFIAQWDEPELAESHATQTITSYFDEGLLGPDPDPVKSLWEKMSASMVSSVFERTETKTFLPQDDIEEMILYNTRDPASRYNHVLQLMGIQPCNASENDRELADYILNYAQKIFLIAIWTDLEQLQTAMELFKHAHFKDEDLPLEEWSEQEFETVLYHHKFVRMEETRRRHPGHIWNARSIRDFQSSQWVFLAPNISTDVQTCNFDKACPIPFIAKGTEQHSGAHAVVYKYTIHPAHFKDSLHQVTHFMAHNSLGTAD